MKIILPCCGKSSRFPGQPPKWTLPAHDGRPMLCHAISGLEYALDDLVVTILAEHEERFQVSAGLAKAFGRPVRMVVLSEPTRSQGETVARTLESLQLDEPFFVKDSDGYFKVTGKLEREENYVCIDSLNNFDSINPRNKSYLQMDQQENIINIREKMVISDTFNVGGYYFTKPQEFLEFYRQLAANNANWSREIYLSDVIGAMVLTGIPFRGRTTTGFKDWGTIREWRNALLAQKTFLVMLDGFVFQRGSSYFRPRFDEVQPYPAAVACLQSLASQGHKIIYLTIRGSDLEKVTREQLTAASLPDGQILWECPIAKWILVTAPHPTLPFLSGQAVDLLPEDPNLLETIEGELNLF